MFGQQQQKMREMTVEVHRLYTEYKDLERRVKEVWLRITGDEKKRQILHPGTVQYLQELMADMNVYPKSAGVSTAVRHIDCGSCTSIGTGARRGGQQCSRNMEKI